MKTLSMPNHSEHVSTNKEKTQIESKVEGRDGETGDTSEGRHKRLCIVQGA